MNYSCEGFAGGKRSDLKEETERTCRGQIGWFIFQITYLNIAGVNVMQYSYYYLRLLFLMGAKMVLMAASKKSH